MIATPIGNLEDITFRAVRILNSVDVIAAEDSRVARKLLNHYEIKTSVVSYRDFNEQRMAAAICSKIEMGQNTALISDAGTPCISDPGYRIVSLAVASGIQVVTIPGPSAVTAGLSISGLPTDHFYFEGFLPRKKGRKTHMEFLRGLEATIVIYESPVRVMKSLKDIQTYFGNRIISICREMTKMFEETFLGSVEESISFFEAHPGKLKGEFVIMIAKEGYSQ